MRARKLQRLVAEGVAQRTDPFDLDLEHVAVREEARWVERGADARRRAGEDDVAGLHRHRRGDVRHELWHAEDQVAGAAGLDSLAVEAAADGQVRRHAAALVCGDKRRPERRRAIPRLARRELLGMALEV